MKFTTYCSTSLKMETLLWNSLNNTFMQTSIGYQDERNRPPPLRTTVFNGSEKYKLK
jgi:hypothetical protein